MRENITQKITELKSSFGKRLVILGHHYQREEIIEHSDFIGDSFGLAKKASETSAEFIVFCGVHFMAESASILSSDKQRVFMPVMRAGCPMADMARIEDVELAWASLAKVCDIKKVVPVAYMNTTAEIKAFCGRHGGIICTSGNAVKALEWAFKRGEKVLFLPDENLGRNTARKMGIEKKNIEMWNPGGGDIRHTIYDISLILWPGYCHVHTFFNLEHVTIARKNYPGCKIIVHPECIEDVVMASDESGSTEGINAYVRSAKKGETIVIGTEINFVARLARENPDKMIIPLARSLCPNMFKTSQKDLYKLLEGLSKGVLKNEVKVPNDIKKDSRVALTNMLSLI